MKIPIHKLHSGGFQASRVNPHGLLLILLALALALSGCQVDGASVSRQPGLSAQAGAPPQNLAGPTLAPTAPEYPQRPRYSPGELVDYTAQTGDTLPNLAKRFNTTEDQIRRANPFIPGVVTTMPPGMPMKIPIYYLPLWGPSYQILPDSLLIDGPAQGGFDTVAFVDSHPGWLKNIVDYVGDQNRRGGEIIDYVAINYSVSPRLLLALLEYQAGALSQPVLPPEKQDYPLGYQSWDHKGVNLQLNWAANLLNNGYYGFRTSHLTQITYKDGRLERFDPWLNAASAALHNYFNEIFEYDDYARAVSPEGFAKTYRQLFGDPWPNEKPHIPGSLVQPELTLPFQPNLLWAFTGGPHTGWGIGEPFAALDFAPPSVAAGCIKTDHWATAMASGVVVRSEPGVVVLDLDGDKDERTGWVIFYLHVATQERVTQGTVLKRGDPIGHPSCEGGSATGTHIHIARKYNGEWIPAEGVLAFNLEGWIAHNGSEAYLGSLTRNVQTVTACVCSNARSFIQSTAR